TPSIMAEKKKPAKKAETAKADKKPAAKAPAKGTTAKKSEPKAAPKKAGAEGVKSEAATAKLSGFVLKQRQRLLDLRDELVDAMSGMAGEIRNAPEGSEASGSGMHQG